MDELELQKYIAEFITKTQESQALDRPLTRYELKEMALSIGLTEEQFREIQVKAISHVQAAKRFLEHNGYEGGLDEAQKAVDFNPYVQDGYTYLALAYYQKYLALKEETDKSQALVFANKALIQNSRDKKATTIIESLNLKKPLVPQGKKKTASLIAIFFFLSLFGGFISFLASKNKASFTQEQFDNKQKLLEEIGAQISTLQTELANEQIRKQNLIKDLIRVIPQFNPKEEKIKLKLETLMDLNVDDTKSIEIDQQFLEFKRLLGNQNSKIIQGYLIEIEVSKNQIVSKRDELAMVLETYNDVVKNY